MADANVPEVILDINDQQLLITERFHGKPAVLSTQVAERFLRRHDHLLRDIATLRSLLPKSFDRANFCSIAMKDSQGKKRPAYLLTRDAFSLLVMGMTGKTSIMWKLRYIEAFNALEQAQMQRERESFENQAELAREAGYLQGRQEALCLPVMQAERKQGYLDGLKEGRKLGKRRDGLRILGKILVYRQKGLSYTEIAKLLGISRSGVGERLSRARRLGLLQPQGNLAEAAS